MRLSSKFGLIGATLLILIGTLLYLGRVPDVPAEELIRQSLRDAETGARNHSTHQIMEVISDDFRAGMWDKRRLYLQVLHSLRDARGTDYDTHLAAPRILPSPKGDSNQRLVLTRLSIFESGSSDDIWGSGDLTLVMRKESRPRLLFFREPYWRIVSVANLPPALEGGL
jgi:hypothetical protein